jgi:hypothetical protein
LTTLGASALPALHHHLSSRIGNWGDGTRKSDFVVIEALGLIGDPSSAAVLDKAMQVLTKERAGSRTRADDSQKAVLVALRRVGSPRHAEWVQWLAPALDSEDLAKVVGGERLPAILAMLGDDDPERQEAGLRLAVETGTKGLAGPAIALLKTNATALLDGDKAVPARLIVQALEVQGDASVVEPLQWWIGEVLQAGLAAKVDLPLEAAFALVGRQGGPAVAGWLLDHLARGDGEAEAPLLALGEAARPTLTRALEGTDAGRRKAAVAILAKMEGQPTEPLRRSRRMGL